MNTLKKDLQVARQNIFQKNNNYNAMEPALW